MFEGSSIFSTLEGAYQHFLKPKFSESALEWGSKASLLLIPGQVLPDGRIVLIAGLDEFCGRRRGE